jgi:hypothetical protein
MGFQAGDSNIKSSDDGVKHTELLGFWTLSIVRYSECFPSHLKTVTDPVSETLCPLLSRISEDGQSTKTQ